MCIVLFTISGCGSASVSTPPARPSASPSPSASESLVISVPVLAADLGASSAPITLTVKDARGNAITGAFPSAVTVRVAAGSAHVALSADGGTTKSATVTAASSAQAAKLQAYYDGNGGSGFTSSLAASAAAASTVSATLNTFATSASVVFGNVPLYAPGKASFSAPSQQLKITASETNFSGKFSLVSNTCGAIAAVAQSGASFTATSQSYGACSITVGDGTFGYPITVTSNVTASNAIVPVPSGTVVEWSDATPNFTPRAIAAGPDGNVWYAGATPSNGVLARITPAGAITDFLLGASVRPAALATGSDGNLWLADSASNSLLRFSMNGTQAGAPLSSGSAPSAMSMGPDGAMWITDSGTGRVTCANAAGSEASFAVPNSVALAGIAAGPDGALYVTDSSAPFVARITSGCTTSSSGVVSEFPLHVSSGSGGIAAGADGALWFTEMLPGPAGALGRMTVDGLYSFYPDADTVPGGTIVLGADRNLWFGGCSCVLGRMTSGGAFSARSTGISATPSALVSGPDGGIWYVTATGSTTTIGRVQP